MNSEIASSKGFEYVIDFIQMIFTLEQDLPVNATVEGLFPLGDKLLDFLALVASCKPHY